jgi:hypothetical protein
MVLLDNGCPDGPNVGIPTQDRNEVSFTVLVVFDLANEPIQAKPNSCVGVLHPLRVFQHPKALMRILHGFSLPTLFM